MDALPVDIIHQIVRINTRNTSFGLVSWRKALPLLGISQRWRAVAHGKIYTHAFIMNSTANVAYKHIVDRSLLTEGSGNLARWSNIGLIIQNGFQKNVQNMTIFTLESKRYISILLCAVYLLSLNDEEYPEIELLESAACAMQQRQKMDRNSKVNCYIAATNIGTIFANTFPNVSSLSITSTCASRTLHSFYIALTERYIGQLVFIYYATPNYFPVPWAASKLEYILINLHDDNNKPLLVDPRNLKCIQLTTNIIAFQWDWFHWDKSSNIVEFENLISMSICGDSTSSVFENQPQHLNNINDLKLKFLSPVNLRVEQGHISLESIKCVAKNSFHLCFEGLSKDIRHVCKLGINHLHSISLHFGCKNIEEHGDDFIETSNEIFQYTHYIKNVICAITPDHLYLDHTRIYWPSVTRLVFANCHKFDSFIPLIECCPDLLELVLLDFKIDEQQLEHVKNVLATLKEKYSKPSSSKLQTWKTLFNNQSCKACFSDYIPFFKWYFPKLKSVKFYDAAFDENE